ncbi:MAG: twin-arginine translocase TatA/TatE family subunit [Acidobacteriota bacterium]
MSELLIVLVIVVVVFGASRLPQLGKGLGEGISNFKKSVRSGKEEDQLDEDKNR